MPEITLEEYELMNRILSDTRTGWWKADYRLQTYFFSKQIMELTGLPSDRLSFADFLNRIRTDFRFRIGEEIATLEQPYVYDMTFPILCPKGEIWIHIKKLHQEKNAHGDSIITGSIQIVDSPETTKSEQAAALRINNLLYQLNNIPYCLFCKTTIHPKSLIKSCRIFFRYSRQDGHISSNTIPKSKHRLVLLK